MMMGQDTLLLACSSPKDRRQISEILSDSYYLLEAVNQQQFQTLLHQNEKYIAAIISDPDIMEAHCRDHHNSHQIPVIIVAKDDSAHTLNRGFACGAADVIPIGYDANGMLRRIDAIVQLHLNRRKLQVMVVQQAERIHHSNEMMMDALSSVIEHRNAESGQHILRIRHFTKILLEEVQKSCPEYGLTDGIISVISSASALHDVGKIAIPDAILTKPGKLTNQEWDVMKTHAEMGCRILMSLEGAGDPQYLQYALNICHHHHERWDGGGYPQGLSGDAIPICAQVVGLADAYDALTSQRVYKDAYPFEVAANMIIKGECGIFSPKLLECFKQVSGRFEALARAYADGLRPETEKFDVLLPDDTDPEMSDSMRAVQGKYQCLLHYINAFVMELAVDSGYYHLRYNPYPELAPMGEARDFAQLEQIVLDEIVVPEERQQMYRLIHEGIGHFLHEGLRRQNFEFRFRGKAGEAVPFVVTLLRADVDKQKNRSMAVLCRKRDDAVTVDSGRDTQWKPVPDEWICCRNDRTFSLVSMSESAVRIGGYSSQDLETLFHGELIRLVHPDDRKNLHTSLREQFCKGNAAAVQCRIRHKTGRELWIYSRVKLVMDTEGRELLYVLPTDITDVHESYRAVTEKMRSYEIILAQTENVLFEWDQRKDSISFSDTWEQIFGSETVCENVGKLLEDGGRFHPDDVEILGDAISNLRNGSDYEMAEVRIATAQARYLWCRFRASAIRGKDGTLEKICGIIINIDAEKQSSQALQDRAERDALTKLLNKYAGRKQAEEYFSRYPQGADCALLMIDLDNFKPINDRYGHLFGDAVLTQVSRVLKKMFRNQDIISRVGGDEFMVLMRGVADPELLRDRCRLLIKALENEFSHLNQEQPLSCSVGVAISPIHGKTYLELFQKADQALYQAKAQGKNTFAFFDSFKVSGYGSIRHATDIDSDREPGLAENSLVQYAFRQLYASKNVDASINEILDLVGQKMNVSRVYIFENSEDNRYCSNTYEWCNDGIAPEIQNLQNICYDTDIGGYREAYDESGIFYCPDIDTLPRNIYDIVAPQGIKSLLHCAILDQGVFRGYIGFDECVTKRMWTKEQIDALTYLSEMLSVFLMKKREQERALQRAGELGSILDNQNAWIYIIDPETCQLKYLNAKARALDPGALPGECCYKTIMGNGQRCEGCPCVDIHRKKTGCASLYNRKLGIQITSEATLIQWDGKAACLIICREKF